MIKVFFLSFQIYFLTVVFNIIAGLILCSDNIKEKIPAIAGFIEAINVKQVKKIAGIGSLVAGVFKLILPVGVIIIGDFIPAVVSFGLGFALLTEFLKDSSIFSSGTAQKIDDLLSNYKNTIGGIGLLVAAVHFLFAGVPVLI